MEIIRAGNSNDLEELQKLLVDTVKEVCKHDYTEEQVSVWISTVENKQRWQEILLNQCVWVAQDKNKIVGFGTLDKGNYLDLLYVHKDNQRQGIAQKLYTLIEQHARKENQTELTSDVSKTAKPFFEKNGFKVLQEQKVILKGVELRNYKMTKNLII